MERCIEIDLIDKCDFVERYDQKKVSSNIIDYIIKQTMLVGRKEKIKIVINKKCMMEQNCIKMIKEGLIEEYDRNMRQRNSNNVKQIWLLILGIILLFLSTLIDKETIWKEILLISGWVPIWEMVEMELFPDVEGRIKRRVIKKILKSEIIEKNIKFDTVKSEGVL